MSGQVEDEYQVEDEQIEHEHLLEVKDEHQVRRMSITWRIMSIRWMMSNR